jgi:hypothetical protein
MNSDILKGILNENDKLLKELRNIIGYQYARIFVNC